MAEAGWYPDPQESQSLQYFDGQRWTGQRRPVPGGANPAAEPTTQNPTWAATRPQWTPTPNPSPSPNPSPNPQNPRYGSTPQAQWAQPQPQGGWSATPSQPGWPPAAPAPTPRRSRKIPLIVGAVVVVAALAAVLVFVVFRGGSDDPTITYQGKALANGTESLTKAEASLSDVVTRRHGARSADTRCYFVRPATPDAGAKKTDIEQTLRCGPVLFVDGTKSSEYVAVAVSGTVSGSKATLTTQDVTNDVTPAKLDQGITLIRPDGKSPPAGDGGLTVPTPPAADKNIITVAGLGSTTPPKPLTGAVMVGLTTRVTLTAAGVVTRYGSDDDARSAPAGQRLIAFQLGYGPGEGSASAAIKATLVVDGQTRTLPTFSGSGEWIIAAVGTSSTPVLRLIDGGVTQTLSLPDGKPGPGNAQVTLRQHTSTDLNELFTVPVRVSDATGSVTVPLTTHATGASLTFWAPLNSAVHASTGAKAILSIRLYYNEPGKTDNFGYDAALLRLRLPGGQLVPARNVSTDPKLVSNVYEVPADFTTGRLEIVGSERSGAARITIAEVHGITVNIAAG